MKMPEAIVAAAFALFSFNASANPSGHVLMISVDGLHALDLLDYTATHPGSALAGLAANGIEYSGARTPAPADSFPGILALTTGGTPEVTGVYFDVSYARTLSPPGSACNSTGTTVAYDESVDNTKAASGEPLLDPSRLPLDPAGCKPVSPHAYLRVNTIFEVVRQAGGYTAWIDKHPSYEIVNGPSGKGVIDLYTPEIGANFEGSRDAHVDKITASIQATERYDGKKVDALINEINGFEHDGKTPAPVPTIFGLNLQEVNVAQKLAGYKNAQGEPSKGLEEALAHSDKLIGRIVSALRKNNLIASTLFIVTAKHGNGPIDPNRIGHVNEKALEAVVERAAPGSLAQITADRAALIWLKDSDKTGKVASAFKSSSGRLGISNVLHGRSLALLFPSIRTDSRAPDIVLIPRRGVIYAQAGDGKKAEHGGFDNDDTNVALLLSNPSLARKFVRVPVATTQVAPTILASLGIAPEKLQAVRQQGTPLLPGEDWEKLLKRH